MKQFFTLSTISARLFAVLLGLVLCSGNYGLQAQTIPTPPQTDEILPPDNGAAGKADPGDKIRYKVTIDNTHPSTPATDVKLNVVPDPRTTLDPLSFRTSPVAVNDAYPCTGNVGLNVLAASGLLANDFDDNPAGLTATAGTFPTTSGGSIMIASNGSFMYTPPPGFTGSDTYTYTLNDGNSVPPAPLTDMATVTFTVSNLIWFIDNASVAATSDGRLTSPFKTLADFNAGSAAAGDVIYIEHTGTAYTGGIVLQNGERLFGKGHTGAANLSGVLPFALAANSKTLPAINGSRPIIENAAGDGILLASGNTVRGLEIGYCSDFAIDDNGDVGTLTISEVNINTLGGGFRTDNGGTLAVTLDDLTSAGGTYGVNLTNCAGTFTINGGTISNPTTAGVLISGGSVVFNSSGAITTNAGLAVDIDNHDSGNATFSGNITSTGMGIRVQNCGGGTKTFSGTSKSLSTGANTAVNLLNNTGATIDFTNGGLVINTTTGTGFSATGGGTVNVAGAGNTITKSGNSNALNIASTNAGGSGITFAGINVTGGTGTAISITTSTGTKNLGTVTVARAGGGTGIFATSAGTLNVTGGTINSGNQVAIDINGAVLGVVLTSVSANGANKGMDIANTTGSFTINGDSPTNTNGSGGTIQNITTRGAEFFSVTNITLRNMAFTNANTADGGGLGACDATQTLTLSCNAALYLRNVNTLVLTNIDVNGTEEQGLNGINITNMTMADCSFINCGNQQYEGSMKIRDLQGTCSITNSTFTFPEDEDVEIFNSSTAAALNLTVTDCVFSDNFDNPIANTGLFIQAASNVTNTINVDECNFLRLKGRGVDIRASAGTMNVNVTDCLISKDVKRFMAGAFVIASGTAIMNINVNRNTIAMANAPGIAIQGSGSSTFNARVNNNTITGPYACGVCTAGSVAEMDPCTCTGQGISIAAIGTSSGIAEAVSNTISGLDNGAYGIGVNSQEDGTLNVLLSTNNITVSNDSDFGIDILASGPTVSPTVCARVINNTVSIVGGAGPAHFRARASGAGTNVNLQSPGGTAAAVWDMNGNMPLSTAIGAVISGSTAGGGTLTFAGMCSTPGHPTAMIDPFDPIPGSRLLELKEQTGMAGLNAPQIHFFPSNSE